VRPKPNVQIAWGAGAAAVALILVAVLALAPDPLFRQRVVTTTFDNVESLSPGAPVYFRGAEIGAIRSVKLIPQDRTFAVRLGVRRDWQPSACTHARIVAANPLTTPRIELVALETDAATCPAARIAAGCVPVAPVPKAPLVGCRRAPDLFETAAVAVAQAAEVAKTANVLALRVQAMLPKGGAGSIDINKLTNQATSTLASVDEMTARLNASLAPGRGDAAIALSNVRDLSGKASTIDVVSINASIKRMETLLADNQAHIDALLSQGSVIATDTRASLENLSSSMSATGANLQRATDHLDALSERIAADPTYVLHGQKYADPPAPGAP
jgi:hypothetical protein